MQIELPRLSSQEYLAEVVEAAQAVMGTQMLEKCLVFAPDAIGAALFDSRQPMFDEVLAYAPLRKPLLAVFPSVTPVCFASLFTGAPPEEHGIRKYEKPVLQCDTLFDALARAGKKVAIVAVTDSSMERIFRGRNLDYFAESYDPQVTDRVLRLLEDGSHDFIAAYQQQYDDLMHRSGPESPEAIQALKGHVESFALLGRALSRSWQNHNRALMWITDHGAHLDPTTGRGTHGEDIPADMQVNHFFGFMAAIDSTQRTDIRNRIR